MGIFMNKGIELSTFKPRGMFEKGGIEVLLCNRFVIPVAGDASGLSEQARIIHAWLIEEHARTGQPVMVRTVINTHGFMHRKLECKTLQGFPLEELQDASLLYPQEAGQ